MAKLIHSTMLAVAIIFCLGASEWARAYAPPIVVKPGRISAPMSEGVSIGGQAGSEFSLLSVSTEPRDGGRAERLVFAYGDRFGQPQRGEPGYFHVAIDHDAKRVVIDLAQIAKTAVDPKRLAKIFMASKLIASSEMTMDPQDGSTNITLSLKEPVSMKVASIVSAQAKLIIDLTPSTKTAPVSANRRAPVARQ